MVRLFEMNKPQHYSAKKIIRPCKPIYISVLLNFQELNATMWHWTKWTDNTPVSDKEKADVSISDTAYLWKLMFQ